RVATASRSSPIPGALPARRKPMSLEASSPKPSSPDRLVHMANQIGKFFASQGADEAVSGTLDHIRKFWDPRMRARMVAHVTAGGQGLDPAVLSAMRQLVREEQRAEGA